MRFLPPMMLHGSHAILPDELTARAALLADRLRQYPDWPELDDLPACVDCEGERKSNMTARAAQRAQLFVANARRSPSYGCALRLNLHPLGDPLGHARFPLTLCEVPPSARPLPADEPRGSA